jgi:hypothetical protein
MLRLTWPVLPQANDSPSPCWTGTCRRASRTRCWNWLAVWQDSVVTEAERQDLLAVAELLGLSSRTWTSRWRLAQVGGAGRSS